MADEKDLRDRQIGSPEGPPAPASLRVKIVGREHPHRGEYGQFTGEVIRLVTGARMALVKLEACRHGGDACYVSPGDVREVNKDDQYV